ncbi:DUF455 family protein [Pelagicoccus sp. SDUM812002]|nr:DUF455 family protein [Pelagicoccus sp. SDUM812002]
MTAVKDMAGYLRSIFEVEREFVRTATALICRVGDIELKYLLCQHVWEAAGHARFIRERGRELSGFGSSETVRPEIREFFEEAVRCEDSMVAVGAFYRVLKQALLAAYQEYLEVTDHLADWPSSKLVEEFVADEKRHAAEIQPYLEGVDSSEWETSLESCLKVRGGWLEIQAGAAFPDGFEWSYAKVVYKHPEVCSRGKYPICSSVFGYDPESDPIVRSWIEDPATDARLVRLTIYVWLMMELDAVDYLSTIFYDTPDAPFDLHYDLARHLWDESRHSQFGYRQLPKLGVDLSKLEHSLDLYNILVQMSPPERYAMMTMEFEAGSFPTKAKVMDRVRELNDFEADTLLAFDRNDEQGHVRYGHRWLPEIMKLFGETRPVAEFVEATKKRFEEMTKEFGGRIPHSLSAEERITGSDLLALAKGND